MLRQKVFPLISLSLLFSMSLFPIKAIFAIGQITEPIIFQDVLRGQQMKAVLTLLNSEQKDVVYEFSSFGDISEWVSFFAKSDSNFANPIAQALMPANNFLEVWAVFNVPPDAPNGVYKGEIIVTTAEDDLAKEATQASVRQSVGREVSIEITGKEIAKLSSQVIPEKYGIKKGKPLEIKVIYENQGNVFLTPSAELEILRGEAIVFNAVFPYPADSEAIKPLETKIFNPLLSWQTAGQKPGEYQAKIAILLNGQTIQEEEFKFKITSLQDNVLKIVSKIGFGSLGLGWFLIGFLFFIIASTLILLSRRPGVFKKLF